MVNHLEDPEPLDPRYAAYLWGVLTGVLLCLLAALGIDWLEGKLR